MGSFSFNGVTIVAPGFVLKSSIGTQRILNLLPFGKLLMIGTSDGGRGNGTIYEFNDLNLAKQVLRGGALLDALLMAGSVGGASGFAACVAGNKSSASSAITGASAASATLIAGDAGAWTNDIQYCIEDNSDQTDFPGRFAFTLQYPNPDGQLITVGGLGSAYDNLIDLNALQDTINNDSLLTPGQNTGLQPVVTLALLVNGVPSNTPDGPGGSPGFVNLTGGSGSGDYINTTVVQSADPLHCTVLDGDSITEGSVLWIGTPATDTMLASWQQVTVENADGKFLTFVTAASAPITAGQTVTNIVTSDFIQAIDQCVDEPFDIGHLVNGYDAASQGYADELSMEVAPLGRLSRWFHQVIATGTSPLFDKATNSTAVVNAGVKRAQALDCPRSSCIAQRTQTLDPTTGIQVLADFAPIICGYAALVGATGPNGPATAMTQDTIPNAITLDYPILGTNNSFAVPGGTDLDRAILGGLMPFVNLWPSGVRCVQSITTAPNDSATGAAWIYAEFSVQRVVDALQANMVAAIGSMQPKGLGAGITIKVAGAILVEMQDVLELALQAQWITGYNKSALSFNPVPASPEDAIVTYDMTPVFPLNHLGIDQTVQPFSITSQQLTTALGT